MADPVLHYIHDPLCGWCYAAGPLVSAASAAGIAVVLHGGGLWEPAAHASEATRKYIREADSRIAKLTDQPFSEAYLDGLLFDPKTLWWSRPTIAAVLAAETEVAGSGLGMIAAIQRAHYVLGQAVVEDRVLIEAAGSIGLDQDRIARLLGDAAVDQHIRETRDLMQRFGLGGYPSFLLEHEGRLAKFSHEAFYNRPAEFVAALRSAGPSQ